MFASADHHPLVPPPPQGYGAQHRRAPSIVHMRPRKDFPSVSMAGQKLHPAITITDRDYHYRNLQLASELLSAGERLAFEDRRYTVQHLGTPGEFNGVDIAGGSVNQYGPAAVASGAVVDDDSSDNEEPLVIPEVNNPEAMGNVRLGQGVIGAVVDDDTSDHEEPLVIPEVNPEAMGNVRLGQGAIGAVVDDDSSDHEEPLVIPEVNPEAMGNVWLGQVAIVANPNRSTVICLMAATPRHRHPKVLRMVVRPYQEASGAGAAAMEELKLQTQEVLEGKAPTCNIFKQQYAFNIFSHNAPVLENGYNEEEMIMVKETRKNWNDKDVKVTATCIRVPVMRAHAESINLQFENPLDEDTAREILRGAPGVTIIDDRASSRFPTPLEVSDKDDVAVNTICQDLSLDDNRGVGGKTVMPAAKLYLDSGATQHMMAAHCTCGARILGD